MRKGNVGNRRPVEHELFGGNIFKEEEVMIAAILRLSITRRLHHWLERRRTRRALSGTALAENNLAEGNVDRLVFHEFFDDDMTERTFVDVGAARPDYLSISALYRKKGGG
jgi:hypothetical protein